MALLRGISLVEILWIVLLVTFALRDGLFVFLSEAIVTAFLFPAVQFWLGFSVKVPSGQVLN